MGQLASVGVRCPAYSHTLCGKDKRHEALRSFPATSLSSLPANSHTFAGFVQTSDLFWQIADLFWHTLLRLQTFPANFGWLSHLFRHLVLNRDALRQVPR